MENNRKYVKVELTEYGYEIYAVNEGLTTKIAPKNKRIMKKVLDGHLSFRSGTNKIIYTDYDAIMEEYYQARENARLAEIKRVKKVNREKSKKIIAGILMVLTLTAGALGINSIMNSGEDIYLDDEPEITTEYKAPLTSGAYEESFGYQTGTSVPSTSQRPETSIVTPDYQGNIDEFGYEFSKPNDKEALMNSQRYMETFKKYEKMYGVDANLLCAIGAQESSGIHKSQSANGGYATGIMGIEYIWADADIFVYNFEKKAYETIKVDYSKIGDLDYNVKVGAAIFQSYFYNTLKNVEDIPETNYMVYTLQKYNFGPGNMWKLLNYGENWIENRGMINAGDKYYFEHVLSRFDNGTVISVRLPDGSYYNTELTNLSLEKQHSRN